MAFIRKFDPLSKRFDIVQDTTLLTLKGVVATTADLPLSGNSENDLYVVKDDGDRLYTWNKTEPSGILSDWIDVGTVSSIDWSIINNKPTATVGDIDDAVTKKHIQNSDEYLNTQITKTLYVDGNRTDSYTENGSVTKPFKTIMAAVNKVISDVITDVTIYIFNGVYSETVTLENAAFYDLCIVADGNVTINKIQSTSNNDTFRTLCLVGLNIGDVEITGASNGTTAFANDLNFKSCDITTSYSIKNVTVLTNHNCKIDCSILLENIPTVASIVSNPGQGPGFTTTVRFNAGTNRPSGSAETYAIIDNAVTGNFVLERLGGSGSCTLQVRKGARLGHGGSTHTVGADCSLLGYGGTIRGNLQNNGSATLKNTIVTGTVSGNSPTYTNPASQFNNDSSVTGTTVKDALNNLTEKNGINGNFTTTDGKTITVVDGQITNIV